MTLTLTPQAEARLQELAARRGQAPEVVIETALDALIERETSTGRQDAPEQPGRSRAATPGGDEHEAEQARLRRTLEKHLAQARALKPEPRGDDPDRTPEEAAFGEIIEEKYRRQGFNL